ncbi:MAG: ribonuclease HII, partial [Saprospiraceae bacterium]|nr:ribonuclease HII [Saprospiraceae bacterium]
MKLLSYYKNNICEAGCDEAGRGCLAGPVVAAAVILNPNHEIIGLNDSKKLKESERLRLRSEIEKKSLAFAVSFIDHTTIDRINILQASLLAMREAIQKIHFEIEHIIID